MEMKNFVFSVVFNFLNFMKKRQNLKNATLREVWPWHLMLKICKIKKKKKKIGFQFCKVTFLEVSDQVNWKCS